MISHRKGYTERVDSAVMEKICPLCANRHDRPRASLCLGCSSRAAARAYYRRGRARADVATCSNCGRSHRRPRSAYCETCGPRIAAATYYKAHGKKRHYSEEEAQRRRQRAYLAVYISRGKVRRGTCDVPLCLDGPVVPFQPFPNRPLEVIWYCRAHFRAQRREAEEGGQSLYAPGPRRATIAQGRAAVDARWERIPLGVRTQIETLARRHPFLPDAQLDEQSPLYQSRLIKLAEQYFEREAGEPEPGSLT